MIEELEAEAVLQMVNEERGGLRGRVTWSGQGVKIEIRARRRRDGGAVLGYSYDDVRVERSVLLALVCTQIACERSQSVKRQWALRNPIAPTLQRRPLATPPVAGPVVSTLFKEEYLDGPNGLHVARPASFMVLMSCPFDAHRPVDVRMNGWDVFKNGRYKAGGLIRSELTGQLLPRFESLERARHWLLSHPG